MTLQMYILRRILLTVPLLLGLTVLTFVISTIVPVDPVLAMLGESAAADPEVVASFRKKWGLDQPLPVQYFTYITRLLHGDLGVEEAVPGMAEAAVKIRRLLSNNPRAMSLDDITQIYQKAM